MSRLSPPPDPNRRSDPDPRRNNPFEQTSKLQKSRTLAFGLPRTPSQQLLQPNPYLQQMDARRTQKKRSIANLPYHAPVLLEQNKQLLAENRQMAMVIHERNQLVQTLERRLKGKLAEEERILKEVDCEKERLVGEVLRHKQQTDNQIAQLQNALSQIADQKQDMEITYNRERRTETERVEKDRKLQLQLVKKNYQESIALAQSQNLKLRNEVDTKQNELAVLQLEWNQNAEQLRCEVVRAKEQAKHMEHLRRLECAQLKHYYQNKLQKVHLDHRRDKELFLTQHETQLKRLEQQNARLKSNEQIRQNQHQVRQRQIQHTHSTHTILKQKLQTEVEQARQLAKQKLIKDKTTIKQVLQAHHEALQSTTQQQVRQLLLQNQRLNDILAAKTQALTRLYSEFDALRDRYCADLEQHERIIAELGETAYSNELANEEINEVLKAKLGCLREADLKGLKSFYEHQIQLLSSKVAEKDEAIGINREKYHNQLRCKAEMRQRFELQVAKLKSTIFELISKVSDLQAEAAAAERDRTTTVSLEDGGKQKDERYKAKVEQFRSDQMQQLQNIIKAKDMEIDQLQNKIQLLKTNQLGELKQKDEQLERLNEQNRLALLQIQREVDHLQGETKKLKQLRAKQKQQNQQNTALLKKQNSDQLDKLNQQHTTHKSACEQQIRNLKSETRTLALQVTVLNKKLQEQAVKVQQHKEQTVEQQAAISSKQKQLLQQFYLQRLKEKDEAIDQLREKNREMGSDLIDARQNYSNIEKKLQQLIEAQGTLREIERKVMQLGKDNNLVKNLRELNK